VLWAEAGTPRVAAPPRERTQGVARRAAVSVSWPSSHECMPRTGPRPRGGTQSQRTPTRARVATAVVADGKAAPPRGRVERLREGTDPFPGCPGLVGQLGRKWHPGPSGSSGGPAHQLGPQSQIQGAQWTSVHWLVGPSPLGRFWPSGTFSPLTAHYRRNADVMLVSTANLIKNPFLFQK
jgi:hypothetical protein